MAEPPTRYTLWPSFFFNLVCLHLMPWNDFSHTQTHTYVHKRKRKFYSFSLERREDVFVPVCTKLALFKGAGIWKGRNVNLQANPAGQWLALLRCHLEMQQSWGLFNDLGTLLNAENPSCSQFLHFKYFLPIIPSNTDTLLIVAPIF